MQIGHGAWLARGVGADVTVVNHGRIPGRASTGYNYPRSLNSIYEVSSTLSPFSMYHLPKMINDYVLPLLSLLTVFWSLVIIIG